MLDIASFTEEAPVFEEEPVSPSIEVVETEDDYGKFYIEPLERGHAITLANPLRRILLSSVFGAAITWVKIDGVLHEYATIPHVTEEVMGVLHNLGLIRIRSVTGRPGKMRLEMSGQGIACAGDVATSSDFEIVNPEQHIASLDLKKSKLSIEMNVETGKGYRPANQSDDLPRGVLPMDAIFNPVRKVNYSIEKTRVGQFTDFERLVLEVWTDGTVSPSDVLKSSAEILVNHFFMFNNLGKESDENVAGGINTRDIPPEIYQTVVEKLDLSPRTLNALKRAKLNKLGDVLEKTDEELFSIRNFGVKSLTELNEKLESFGYSRTQSSVEEVSVDGDNSDVAETEGEE
ncbi:DNA-directed RNA polymerase subunit alpha [SAR202 cluster bacterium AC-409-J13_OGT_754m]|nr:DNA-directed RNA polymerase subunit alpha [SAR202 cluster bacterium AC-409-J13_OGT_754m]